MRGVKNLTTFLTNMDGAAAPEAADGISAAAMEVACGEAAEAHENVWVE